MGRLATSSGGMRKMTGGKSNMFTLLLLAAAVVPAGNTFECTPTAVWDGDGPMAFEKKWLANQRRLAA